MKHIALAAAFALVPALPLAAQDQARALSPSDIVNAAPQEHWVVIAPEDLLVMTLAPDAEGKPRQVVIQLMPPPFSQGWVHNIRLLARSSWYDGTSVNRVQDNYVTQWGDPNYDNPEATGKPKPLPQGLKVMTESDYLAPRERERTFRHKTASDPYAQRHGHNQGWPIAWNADAAWPVHCYGMVGVGRSYSPDTGSGAELYTVIGHAPRHLDRNIALVGRVIGGMEHLSSLPRGTGALGFYTKDETGKRTPIRSVRVASDLPEEERPLYEYLSTQSATFAAFAEAVANRRDPFFITPSGGADICNIRVPVRPFVYNDPEDE